MAHIERTEFDALSAADARARANSEPDETRRAAWLQLASEIDKIGPEATSGGSYGGDGREALPRNGVGLR
jgi:hypothetical protein